MSLGHAVWASYGTNCAILCDTNITYALISFPSTLVQLMYSREFECIGVRSTSYKDLGTCNIEEHQINVHMANLRRELERYIKNNSTYTKNCKIFITTIELANFYWFLSEPITNITFLPTINDQLHQLRVKNFVYRHSRLKIPDYIKDSNHGKQMP